MSTIFVGMSRAWVLLPPCRTAINRVSSVPRPRQTRWQGTAATDDRTATNASISTENVTATAYPVQVLAQTDSYLIVAKPHAVVCHHSDWTGSRAQLEIPMLQRVRNATGRRVNLIHRLDRGCSGCLLLAFANNDESSTSSQVTAQLSQAMAARESKKTYIALVRGEGILHGRDFRTEGWFRVDRPIHDERGRLNNATTWFRFVAGQDNQQQPDKARASLVLCRPETGRWHQIRRHLNGLSHPILGDSSHGNSQTNREWRAKRGLLPERTCLHLARLELPPTLACPDGIDVQCPLADDMMGLLEIHMPSVLEQARVILREEGIILPHSGHRDG